MSACQIRICVAAFVLALAGLAVVSRADILYVANHDGNTASGNPVIEKYNSSGVGSAFVNPTSAFQFPIGLAFDSAGNLYAGLDGTGIEKVTPTGGVSAFLSNPPSGIGALAFDSAGNLYASYFDTDVIEKFTPGGVPSVFASAAGGALAFDSAGNLYSTSVLRLN